jgi:D-alanine-D-alanine ligase-like ATP-grasp enzyme
VAAASESHHRPAVDTGARPIPLAVAGEALSGMSDLRRYFRQNRRPIFFIGATDFNLAGMDQWISEFRHICYIDSYDGRHPNVYVPKAADHDEFHSIEDVNNYLLGHKDVIRFISARGGDPVAVFLMFDEQTEALCKDLGMQIWLPPAALRSRLDNKVETVRIGNKAGVPSVPNVLSRVKNYKELQRLAARAGLGTDLVVQAAYGDSGHTTFFIASRADWRRHAPEIAAEPEVKIMKRIDPLGSTLEACVTRSGTVVGPLLTELIGHPELTPYRGGWCGNEMFPDAFSQAQRSQARGYAEKLGDQLLNEGYRGYFDVDFLIDRADGTVYLGELNPRICGASPITNHGMFAHADVPLFLFHLLEFSGVQFELDIGELNARWADPRFVDSWSEIVLKSSADEVDFVTAAPDSGLWRLDAAGRATYNRFDYHRSAVETDGDGLFLRITGPGDYRYKGADLGILITRGRLMTDEFELNDRARAWIAGLSGAYRARALEGPAPAPRATISKML